MSRNDHALGSANKALALMAERGIEPKPANFELFFAYTSGENVAVSRVLGDLLGSRKELTPEVLDDLRGRFFSDARMENALDKASTDLASTVNTVTARLETAERDAVAYGRALSEASGELGESQSPDELRKLVTGLKSATRAMEERTKSLKPICSAPRSR